jgi:AraC-like DNA-binding protein
MLLYISIAAIFISSITFYFNWKTNKNSAYLSILLLIIAIHGISHSFILQRGPIHLIAIFFNNFSPLYFLPGPLIYFYVQGTLNDDWRIKTRHFWHFIPFIITIIIVSPYLFSSFEEKLNFIRMMITHADNIINLNPNKGMTNIASLISRAVLIMVYTAACFIQLYRYHPSKKEQNAIPKEQLRITYRWLVILVISIFLIGAGYLLSALQYRVTALKLTSDPTGSDSPFALLSVLAFLLIPLTLIYFPQILYGIPIDRKLLLEEASDSVNSSSKLNELKQTTALSTESETSEEPFSEMAKQIMDYLQKQKPFLDADFSIDDLSHALNIQRHHLYYCMNKVMKMKFTELKRKLRIEHAKQLLKEGKNKTLSIEGIGSQSGFSSRSNFFTTFKTEVGMTPTEYLEQTNKVQDEIED